MEAQSSWILRLLQIYFPISIPSAPGEGRISNLNPRLKLHDIIIICDNKTALQTAKQRNDGFIFTHLIISKRWSAQTTLLALKNAASLKTPVHLCSRWLHPLSILLLPFWTLAGFPSLKSSAAFLVNSNAYQPDSLSLGAYWISDENTAELYKQLFSFTIISND